MKIELASGESVSVVFHDTDGEITIKFDESGIVVYADMEDPSGRGGEIYKETFESASDSTKPRKLDWSDVE